MFSSVSAYEIIYLGFRFERVNPPAVPLLVGWLWDID